METIHPIISCPNCGYEIDILVKTQAKYDYPCPRCGEINFSKFETIRTLKIDPKKYMNNHKK